MDYAVTRKRLKRYRTNKQEIALLENEIANMTPEEFVWDVVNGGDGKPVMISGNGSNKIPMLSRRKARLIDECRGIEDFILGIDDTFLRTILTLKYIKGLSWTGVAIAIGGGNSGDSVRKICERSFR